MKKIVLIALLGLVGLSIQAQNQHADRPSVHGMLLFGTEQVYASHLPMFHSPHNYQVILSLQLDKQTKKRFVSDQKAHPENATYTLAPERFVLPEMLAHPRTFKAVLYRGHFERGGETISDSVTVSIREVIYQKKLDDSFRRSATANYILFGNEKEQFAVHVISAEPDFDHVIQVSTDQRLTNSTIEVVVNEKTNELPNVGGNRLFPKTVTGTKMPFLCLRQLYLEFDDLK